MNPKRNAITTRGKHSYGNLSGSGITGYIIHPGRFYPGTHGRYLRGTLYGVNVSTREEADRLGMEYGYTHYHGRNSGGFVMSRAARKRGYTTGNGMYNRAVQRFANR